jgi:Rrf2 family protein
MLTLSKQSDYGLIIISQLKGKNDFVPLSELISNTNLPQRFLARIAALLVNNKLLISREGRVGGYKLAPGVQKISVYEYLKIFEKQISFLSCIHSKTRCRYEKVCKHKHGVHTKLNQIVLQQMKNVKLMELF